MLSKMSALSLNLHILRQSFPFSNIGFIVDRDLQANLHSPGHTVVVPLISGLG